MRRPAPLVVALVAVLSGSAARGHWCHDIFASSYNIVVRPAADVVTVPAGSAATLDVFVQNNLGYPLENFTLTAAATGYTITLSRQAPKVPGYLMPGESLRHTLSISQAGGSSLPVDNIGFFVSMGTGAGSQSQCYGATACGNTKARSVVLKKTTGATLPLGPIPLPSLPNTWDQAQHLRQAAQADFGDTTLGLDGLLTTYCVGRTTWGYESVVDACCPNSTTTICPPASCGAQQWSSLSASDASGPDGPHLWAAGELAIRKSALGPRAATFRDRLRCSWGDPWLLMRGYAAFVLGYLGEDAGARAFLAGIISSTTSSAEDKAVAKASLLLFKNPSDLATWRADVAAGTTSANQVVALISAASLGIAESNDTVVTQVLLPVARWSYPFDGNDAVPVFAGQLLNLVAWDRRGWSAGAGDTGTVSFYGAAAPDTVAPRAPLGVSCTPQAGGAVRLAWAQVNLDVSGQPENVTQYRAYRGTTARPAGAQRPGELGFDYDHLDPTASLFFNFPALPGAGPHFFTVVAVDAAGNSSVYGAEVSCTPRYAPVAAIACTPGSGLAPLSVTCDSATSTDGNGAADITTRTFTVQGQAAQSQAQATYSFATAGARLVTLTVTDSTGLSSSATDTVAVSTTTNNPPSAVAGGTPTTGAPPLAVAFSSAGSADPDPGQTLHFSWDFGDGSPASTLPNPSHTYATPGTYLATLTATDDALPAASGEAQVSVRVSGNAPLENVASARVSPRTGAAPLQVTFDATDVTDPDGLPVGLQWSFGDGSAGATTAAATHTYAGEGTYTATLTATDTGTPAIAPATATFTITVTPPGAQNRPPDCSAAQVTPLSGGLPLTITLDATGCTDPDGDALRYLWRVPTSMTSEQTFTGATATAQLTEARTVSVELTVSDTAAAPLETSRSFAVTVTPAGSGPVTGFCGCATGATPWGALALVLVGFLRRRRR